ncbi:MAG: hypothetical protein ACI8XZ_005012 [Gammaproteobacteria bacterium]|jgi:hypothetical protein
MSNNRVQTNQSSLLVCWKDGNRNIGRYPSSCSYGKLSMATNILRWVSCRRLALLAMLVSLPFNSANAVEGEGCDSGYEVQWNSNLGGDDFDRME